MAISPASRMKPRGSERRSGERKVTLQRVRIQTRSRKDLVRYSLHVQVPEFF